MCLSALVLRLRQLVLAASDLEPALAGLAELFDGTGGGAPAYRDPGVGMFGLANGVLNVGRDFVEVVSPTREGSAAGRWIERHGGDGGYMLMVDGPPSLVDRQRLSPLDLRVVHEIVLPDVTDLHLHPKDVGGVLLALDSVDPPGSWRWGGPAWTGTAPPAQGGLRSVRIAVDSPEPVTRRWAAVLGLPDPNGRTQLALDDGQVVDVVDAVGVAPGAVAATFALPVFRARSATVAGVVLDVVPLDPVGGVA